MSSLVQDPILVPCDRVLREPTTNKAHLQGVFDKVLVRELPAGLDCWLYVSFYLTKPGQKKVAVQFSVERPDGKVDLLPGAEFAVAESKVEGDIHLQQVPITGYGLHRIGLRVAGEHVCAVRLVVDPMPASMMPPAAPVGRGTN